MTKLVVQPSPDLRRTRITLASPGGEIYSHTLEHYAGEATPPSPSEYPIVQFSSNRPGFLYIYPGNPAKGTYQMSQLMADNPLQVGSQVEVSNSVFPAIEGKRLTVVELTPNSMLVSGVPAEARIDTSCCNRNQGTLSILNLPPQPITVSARTTDIISQQMPSEPAGFFKQTMTSSAPAQVPDFLANGWTLQTGEFIQSPNGDYRVTQRSNGNLCLSRANTGLDIWCSLQTFPPRAVGYTDFFTIVWSSVIMTFRGKPTGAFLRDGVPIWGSLGIGTNETLLDGARQMLLGLLEREGGWPQGPSRTWLRVYDNGNLCVTVGPNHIDSRPLSCRPFSKPSTSGTTLPNPFGPPIRLPF